MSKKDFYLKKKKEMKQIAEQNVLCLFKQAKEAFSKSSELADRCVASARKIAMKYKLRIPRELKRQFCKHCYKYFVPGKTGRVRTHKGKVVYYCFNCKKHTRFVMPKKV